LELAIWVHPFPCHNFHFGLANSIILSISIQTGMYSFYIYLFNHFSANKSSFTYLGGEYMYYTYAFNC
jgi:hypothetical protein